MEAKAVTQKEFFGNPKLAPLLTLTCILAWAGAFVTRYYLAAIIVACGIYIINRSK